MTKEQIFTEIQNIVSANPVLVIGSGASVPYNIPGMNTLAAELKDFLGANPYKILTRRKPYMNLLRI